MRPLKSQNSANEMIFDTNRGDYKEKEWASRRLTDKKEVSNNSRQNRRCNIIWFPPFNKDVETNVAKQFLSLLDKYFPLTNRPHNILNQNNRATAAHKTWHKSSKFTKKRFNT